jgi:hypothetical protein
MSCDVIGDSIAVGVGRAARCEIHAHQSASSHAILRYVVLGDLCAISVGSNDALNPKLRANVEQLRRQTSCGRIIWILPIHRRARAIDQAVAYKHGDIVVTFKPGPDGVHPESYPALARKIKP